VQQGHEAEVHFRLTIGQRMAPMAGVLVGMLLAQTGEWTAGNGFEVSETLHFSVVFLAAALLGSAVQRGFGVTLTPSAAIVHNLNRRVILWPDVQAVRVERFLSSRTVVLYEVDGRRTRLRAPLTGFLCWDRRFEEKFHTVGRWWLDHRGPYWASWQDAEPPSAAVIEDERPAAAL
jgi:hypothetical protein